MAPSIVRAGQRDSTVCFLVLTNTLYSINTAQEADPIRAAGGGYPLARTLIRLTPVAALIVTPLRAIPGTLLDADQSRMGFATRVLLHLHGDDVTDL